MYKVCGFTNYGCNVGEAQIFGRGLELDEAIALFLSVSKDVMSLNFTQLDAEIDGWAKEYGWDEEEYRAEVYSGSIILYDENTDAEGFFREVAMVYVERDPISRISTYGQIELWPDITAVEREQLLSQS